MNDFTASNGITVVNRGGNWDRTKIHFSGEVLGLTKELTNARDVVFEDRDFEALREFFQAEADERLGRWRWPENPDYVVYPQEDGGAWVFAESEPGSIRYSGRVEPERQDAASTERLYVLAGRAYFDAHPEPKPWHDAEPGEGWLLTIDGRECAAVALADPNGVFGGVKFETAEHGLFGRLAMAITAGRRFWPEVSS